MSRLLLKYSLKRTYATGFPSRPRAAPLPPQGFPSWGPARTPSIADATRKRFCKQVDDFLHLAKQGPVSSHNVRSVLDHISHISSFHPGGEKHLAALGKFVDSFKSQDGMHPLPPSARVAVRWGRTVLRRTPAPRGNLVDVGLYVDASPWGVGLVVGSEYECWRWSSMPGGPRFDINIAELIAFEVAVRLLAAQGLRDTRVRIRTDSQAVQVAFLHGRGWCPQANACLRRIAAVAIPCGLWPELERVGTKENLADPPSRGRSPPGCTRIERVFPLPQELGYFLERHGQANR